jgi:hypothetical protein
MGRKMVKIQAAFKSMLVAPPKKRSFGVGQMHDVVGNQKAVIQCLHEVQQRLAENSPDIQQTIVDATGATTAEEVESHRLALMGKVTPAIQNAQNEGSHGDVHYVSRLDFVGCFQSALATVFSGIPEIQGYGDANPTWITVPIDIVVNDIKSLFQRIHQDRAGGKLSLWQAVVKELLENPHPDTRSKFPAGVPAPRPFPDKASIAILGDWGGDNPAARNIANVVKQQRPDMGIHLGDIYYGGTKIECEAFLRLWPLRQDPNDPKSQPLAGKSFALNGNHEMYSGGEYYFNLVLPAFDQPQSFFCLENSHWRLIGLDTAYAGGHLKPASNDDPITGQWEWLIDILRNGKRLANIFLTHHEPVSAHKAEFDDSAGLRSEVDELLAMQGIGQDAIFGWIFGHEHRCALYEDSALPYNARLIGNGCIPHVIQTEQAADPGCTPVEFFNRKAIEANTAISSFAKLDFAGEELTIYYPDENNGTWGAELWNATKGRFGGMKFTEYDTARQ